MLCTVCLKADKNLVELNVRLKDDISISLKLRQCVPEVDWREESEICVSCIDQLENVCGFREMCIQSYLKTQKSIVAEEETKENDIFESTANIDTKSEDDGEFGCFHCDKKFSSKTVLERHIKYEHTKRASKCDLCGKTLSSESALKRHKSTCAKKRDQTDESKTCEICGTSFSNKYLLKRHLRNVHATEKKFKCELCDRKFASPVYLNAHKKYHLGDRTHICSFCGKGYITASDLYHHEKIHTNKRAYQCQACPKAFNTSSDLHKHKICVHMDRSLWKYQCSFCQRRFPLKTNLDTHIKTHTGERNFLCHLCDRRCINRSVLKRHLQSHSVAKSFKCHLCLLGYKYQKSLDIHMVRVHGIGDTKIPERVKKFFCDYCPKSYFANNKLQKHIRSHTGERPFGCPACEKSFIDKSYIKQHLKSAHNVF